MDLPKCKVIVEDDAKEFCFECMTPRVFDSAEVKSSASLPTSISRDANIDGYVPSSLNRGWSILFLVLSVIIGIGGCIVSHSDAQVVGGDAYNYIIGAGRGTAIVGVAIVFAIIGLALAVFDLTNVILYYNKNKD